MKRLLLSGLVLLGAVAAAGLSARAYFTSQVTNSDNQITTGTLVVNIADPSASPAIDISGLAPGETKSQFIAIVNNGDLSFKWIGYLNELLDEADLSSELTVNLVEYPSEYDYSSLVAAGYNLVGTADLNTVSDLDFDDLQDRGSSAWEWSTDTGYAEFAPREAVVYRLDITMNDTAGDELQGTQWQGELLVDATQWSNPGWD